MNHEHLVEQNLKPNEQPQKKKKNAGVKKKKKQSS